ncbi:MAG: hypothetical protein ACREOU_00070 [Candidatus Eiseniibacteriota bacterium]
MRQPRIPGDTIPAVEDDSITQWIVDRAREVTWLFGRAGATRGQYCPGWRAT